MQSHNSHPKPKRPQLMNDMIQRQQRVSLTIRLGLTCAFVNAMFILGALSVPSLDAQAQALEKNTATASDAIDEGASWDDVNWVPLDEALENASEDRLVFIYVHATWCPYCGRMNTEILPRSDIQELLSEHFEAVRIDTDSKEEVQYFDQSFTEEEFAAALQNESLPTVYFMTAEGNVLAHQPGLLPVDVMAKLLEFLGTGAYQTTSYDAFEPTVIPQTEENP